jgi:PAS domain S-box-containing protein
MTPPVILVVDDNPTNLLLITEVLTWEGCVVEPASDAASAQAMLSRRQPDLILMDIGLPGMDGLTFTRQLKADARTRSIPIAAVTASAMKGDDERVFAAGCDAYVTKPIDAHALIQTIARLLKRPISTRSIVNPTPATVPRPSAQADAEHVLIADDFAPNRLLLRDILEADGFRVSESSDGVEALAVLEREPVDAVVSDVLMPNIDGFRLCMEIRRNPRLKSMPFIVYTSTYSSSADKALAEKVGADHYLVKPSPAPVVVATIRNAIKAGSSRRSLPVLDDEMGVIKQYNEALVAKLEKKHDDLSRALAELQEAGEFSRQIIAGAREGVAVFDQNLRYRVFNPCMEEMTQLSATAVIGKSPAEVLPAERAVPLQTRLQRALAGEVAHSEDQFVRPRPDQPGRWIASKASPLRDARGAIVGVIVVVSDITERKHAENALRESETRFRQLAENIEEVLWITDPTKSEMLFISPAYERIWLRSCTTLYTDPRTWIDAIHPEDRSRVLTAAKERQVLGTYDEVYRILRTDGTLRWIRDRAFPIRDGDGRVYRIAGIAEDITVRREAEVALRESEERYRRLIDDVRDAVFTLREDGLITSLNPAFETITGYACGEWIGTSFWPLVDASDRDRAGAQFLRVLQGERTAPFEIQIRKKDGSSATVEFSSTRQTAGGRTSVVGIGRDVTERKRLAAQFLQAQKIEAIGTLAGGIAHDFNNILTGINGYLELARLTAGDNEGLKDYLDAALSGGMRAADLIRQIMAFSRQEDAQRKPIYLHYVVREALRLLRPTIPSTIEVITEFDKDAPAVLADPTQVHQIVMNLATNAWHAMKGKSGRLQITVDRTLISGDVHSSDGRTPPGPFCRISVRDTGHGMTPQTLERIFEPFFTTKPRGEGTGLGLSAVHGIMQNHGGHIRVTSQPGQGSCFELYFPAHEVGRHDTDSVDSQVNRGQGEAVLFVDDEAFLVRLASRLLESLGYTPYATTDAQEALALVRAQPDRFRVVVTDLTMPGLTGIELAEEIFKINPGLPIILTTGYTADGTEDRLKALGMLEILPKPPTREALARAVERALLRRENGSRG